MYSFCNKCKCFLQLSLASIHYLRSHYQEAIDIYKRILLDNREYLALNVYVALCYYKLVTTYYGNIILSIEQWVNLLNVRKLRH